MDRYYYFGNNKAVKLAEDSMKPSSPPFNYNLPEVKVHPSLTEHLEKGHIFIVDENCSICYCYPMGFQYGQEEYSNIPQQMYGTMILPYREKGGEKYEYLGNHYALRLKTNLEINVLPELAHNLSIGQRITEGVNCTLDLNYIVREFFGDIVVPMLLPTGYSSKEEIKQAQKLEDARYHLENIKTFLKEKKLDGSLNEEKALALIYEYIISNNLI